jgi:hypothetical protein
MTENIINRLIIKITLVVFAGILLFFSAHAQQDTLHINTRDLFVNDSLQQRQQFITDSLLARELFVKDSIESRQKRFDSLEFLRNEFLFLFDAYFRTVNDDIIVSNAGVSIVGDTALSDYVYTILPFAMNQPYAPWKVRLNLNNKGIQYKVDQKTRHIVSVQSKFMTSSFSYGNQGSILLINELAAISNNSSGRFYLTPVDSVFFDSQKRISKIKRYILLYSLGANNQRGSFLFTNLSQVRQFEYGSANRLVRYQLVNFCERWKIYEPVKVCTIINYVISQQGNNFMLIRNNDPSNNYSDGHYTFEFDKNNNLTQISFRNLSGSESWQRMIEINSDGNVGCYIEKANDMIIQSQCMTYHLNEPGARYPVETIVTTFEKDGISYYQKNSTTGKIRTRDRLTLEWSAWK